MHLCNSQLALQLVQYTIDAGLSDIAVRDLDILKNLTAEMFSWMAILSAATNWKYQKKTLKDKLMRQSKEMLVKCLLEGY